MSEIESMLNRRLRAVAFSLLIVAGFSWEARAIDIFPSGGNDVTAFNNAIAAANPGDTIFVHGGTYHLNNTINISKSGTSADPINMFAADGETPILDCSTQTLGERGISLSTAADWWHIKGLTIEQSGDNGLYTEGDHGTFEQIVTRYNRDSGLQLHNTASNNLVLNCDSYENYDANNNGENADGFAIKNENVGPGNIFRGDRAWGNSDDGFDTFYTEDFGVLIQDCWSFDNGINIWGDSDFQGDKNGFKLGRPGGPSVLVNSLAVDNPHNGVDANASTSALKVYNTTSFRNIKNWRFDQPISTQILQNNISYLGANNDSIDGMVSDSFNSWNGGVVLDADDFESLDRVVESVDLLKAPRQADGSLPDLAGFLRLAADSDLIDAGTPISFVFNGVTYNLPYNDSAPDLGAYEFEAPMGLMGDYNDNGVVDAADYAVWRDVMSGGGSLTNDSTPTSVDEADFWFWREHFGDTPGSGAGALRAPNVPEPGTLWLMLVAAGISVQGRRRRSAR